MKVEITPRMMIKARWEFTRLITTCACSRASIEITEKEVAEAKGRDFELTVHIPSCTPKNCFPILYNLLYPDGGFNKVSYLVTNYRKRKKREGSDE